MFLTLKPCHIRRSSFSSAVSRVALRTMDVAATMQSGSLCFTVRRRAIVSFFISSVRLIMEILSNKKAWRFFSSSGDNSGLANNSISVMTLMNKSASSSSFSRSEWITLPLVVRKITALVSSTKRFLVIPLVPDVSLVSYAIAVSVRGNNAKILRNGFAAWGNGLRPMNRSRCKGKNSPSRRYFGGYVNNQPVVNRNFYCLRNAHKENIA